MRVTFNDVAEFLAEVEAVHKAGMLESVVRVTRRVRAVTGAPLNAVTVVASAVADYLGAGPAVVLLERYCGEAMFGDKEARVWAESKETMETLTARLQELGLTVRPGVWSEAA